MCSLWLDKLHAAGPNALPQEGKYECTRSLESAMAASGLSPSMLLQGGGGDDEGAALPQLPGMDEMIIDADEIRDAA